MAKNVYTASKPEKAPRTAGKKIEFKLFKWLEIPKVNRGMAYKGFFIFSLLMLSIMSHHNYVSILKQIEEAKREKNGARALYLNLKSKHEVQQRQSEVEKLLKELESEVLIVESPPTKIMVKKK